MSIWEKLFGGGSTSTNPKPLTMSLVERFSSLSGSLAPSCATCGKRLNGFMTDAEGYEKFGMMEWLGLQSNPNRIIVVYVCRSQSDGSLGCGSLRCGDCHNKTGAAKCPRCGSIGFTKGLAFPDEFVHL
jgi:hypothetical protein